MIYVTVRQKETPKSVDVVDLLNNEVFQLEFSKDGSAGTITNRMENPTPELLKKINTGRMLHVLKTFNEKYEYLREKDRRSLYKHFSIPKKNGGLRPIDEPCSELQDALEELKIILYDKFGVLYHTAAFAYVKRRNTVQQVRKHQVNNSNWFLKTDFSGFFPSINLDFTMRMMEMIFPLSELCKISEGKIELRKALELGFLNDGLPQGTKLSPYLSNVVCIPMDYTLFNYFAHKRFVYTRYADDIHISCVQSFKPEAIVGKIQNVVKDLGAPFVIKTEKTRYGSRKGKNWQLGLMLNAENNITVGWRSKARFKAATFNLIQDTSNGKFWEKKEIEKYVGMYAYYKMVENEYFDKVIERIEDKLDLHVKVCILYTLARYNQ